MEPKSSDLKTLKRAIIDLGIAPEAKYKGDICDVLIKNVLLLLSSKTKFQKNILLFPVGFSVANIENLIYQVRIEAVIHISLLNFFSV